MVDISKENIIFFPQIGSLVYFKRTTIIMRKMTTPEV